MNLQSLKRTVIGEPFPTGQEIHERLDKVRALAVFASDPISSNAYATEAIMSVLVVLGSGALAMLREFDSLYNKTNELSTNLAEFHLEADKDAV